MNLINPAAYQKVFTIQLFYRKTRLDQPLDNVQPSSSSYSHPIRIRQVWTSLDQPIRDHPIRDDQPSSSAKLYSHPIRVQLYDFEFTNRRANYDTIRHHDVIIIHHFIVLNKLCVCCSFSPTPTNTFGSRFRLDIPRAYGIRQDLT